ncbi:MAG: hypothetical protein P4L46_14915 [Fimbriimonas sp.]|nr:hypothetical protein [Fimbriimonas sp.]
MEHNLDGSEIQELLAGALQQAEKLQARIEAGEEIDEKELTALSRVIATQIEEVRSRLEAALGPIDGEALRERLQTNLTPEEFAEWEAGEAERRKFRDEFALEQPIRRQLEDRA